MTHKIISIQEVEVLPKKSNAESNSNGADTNTKISLAWNGEE